MSGMSEISNASIQQEVASSVDCSNRYGQILSALLLAATIATQLMNSDPAAAASADLNVTTANELQAALDNVQPGQTIFMADGTYRGYFDANRSGTEGAPITLQGSAGVILAGPMNDRGQTLQLNDADYMVLKGFAIKGGISGLVLSETDNAIISGLNISGTGNEGLAIRNNSSSNKVENSFIHDTGQVHEAYGEGIYIGTAYSNWDKVTNGKPDKSDSNVILRNVIRNTPGENIDIKEGTRFGIIRENSFDGRGMDGVNHADSWVDIKGNNYNFEANKGVNAMRDGYQTHAVLEGWGNNNKFVRNISYVNSGGYAYNIDPKTIGNVVRCINAVRGAELTNDDCL